MLGLIGALLSVGGSAWAQLFDIRTVALSGQAAPGAGGASYLSLPFSPALNASGQIAFFASLTGPGVTGTNNSGIWSGGPGSVVLLMREGAAAPGTAAGVNYSSMDFSLTPNASGQSAFIAQVTGSGVTTANDRGIWSGIPGGVGLVAREGNPAPGAGAGVNYNFSFTSQVTLNGAGQSAFFGLLTGSGVTSANDDGIWVGTAGGPGSVALLARSGSQASGLAAGVNYSSFGVPAINAAGQSAFVGSVSGPGITPGLNDSCIWSGGVDSLVLVARGNEPAPGTGAGVNFMTLSNITFNASSQSAFFAYLTGAGVANDNDSGIWAGAPGTVALVAREGNPAPGTAPGVNFSHFAIATTTPTLNQGGQSAFEARLTGSGITTANDSGVWAGAPGSLAKVFREGDVAPGAGTGTRFGDASLLPLAFNDRGDVVFFSVLTGPSVTIENDNSLWFSDVTGNVSLIVRDGNSLEVAPGDTRVISDLAAFLGGSGDEDGFPCGFNDVGQLAFYAAFTDGSKGIFIATPALQLRAAVSRKMHGALGPFDINLPLALEPGVECRSSSMAHTLVFTFSNSVVGGSASVTTGTGSVSGTPTFATNTMTVNLTGVTDVQKITLTLSNVTDSFGQVLPNTVVSMNVLAGDTNGNKTVNATDIGQTKTQSGIPVTIANFRQDVTPTGAINASDIGLVKSRSGFAVP